MSKIVNRENLKAFRQKLDDKYVIEGEYSPETKVGYADESGALTPYGDNSGANDTTPFVFQSTGGSSDVGSKAYLRALRGNSVAFNQLNNSLSIASQTINDVVFTNNGDGSWTINGTASADTTKSLGATFQIIAGHYYLLCGLNKQGSNSTFRLLEGYTYRWNDIGSGSINTAVNSGNASLILEVKSGTQINFTFYPQFIDLTLMFGAGNEPTSVVEFNRLFPKPYCQYNAGTLLSCKVNGIKNVGYNAFDGNWTQGGIDSDGTETSVNNSIKSTNFMRVIQGQTYTLEFPQSLGIGSYSIARYDGNKNFISKSSWLTSSSWTKETTLPDNCAYIKITAYKSAGITPSDAQNSQVCVHLTWDGSKTGYEEHKVWQYALPNIELRSAGSVYDELKPDGTLIRIVGVVDLGSLSWGGGSGYYFSQSGSDIRELVKKPSDDNVKANIICSTLLALTTSQVDSSYVGVSIKSNGAIILYNPNWTFSSQITGILYYELATSTETQDDNYKYQESQDVDDYGTQEFLYDNNIAIPVPQGNEFFYPVDYKAFVDSLGGREDIEYDASQLVSQTELSASETARDTIDSQLKDAIGGLLCQTLSLSASLDVLNIDYIDLGSLTWTSYGAYGNGNLFYVSLSGQKIPSSGSTIPNCLITKKYKLTSSNGIQTDKYNKNYALLTNGQLWIIDSSYSTADTFKTAMKGVLLAYEKA